MPGRETGMPEKQEKLQFGWKHMLSVLWKELFPLIKANLCFLLFCLPVVTIPPAVCALYAACTDLIRGKQTEMFRLFWDTLRSEFFRAWGAFAVLMLTEIVSVSGAAHVRVFLDRT